MNTTKESVEQIFLNFIGEITLANEGKRDVEKDLAKAVEKILTILDSEVKQARIEEVYFISSFNPTDHLEFKQVIKSRINTLKDELKR